MTGHVRPESSVTMLRNTQKRSVETHGKNIPQYSGDLKQAAAVAGKLGNTLTEVGKGLMFKVPTNIEWHPPYRPEFVWTMPLEAQANALKAHGQSINEMSGTPWPPWPIRSKPMCRR